MKRCVTLALTIFLSVMSGACGSPSEPSIETRAASAPQNISSVSQSKPAQHQSSRKTTAEPELSEVESGMTSITVTVGNSVFTAKLYDSDTSKAFLAKLPMTLNMSELNGNEKYYYLTDSLPTDSRRVKSINTGDLMLYGSDCIVLFYESFSTSYSYTGLGFIEDTSGLADALGLDSAEVSFSVGD